MRTWTSALLLSGLLVACDSNDAGAGGSSGLDTAATSGPAAGSSTTGSDPGGSTSSTTGDNATNPTTGDNASDDDGPRPPVSFDFGGIPDLGELDDGCNAVDFLFVIDNSGSMYTAQSNLIANFPAFIDGIQATLTDVDSYHVGIATSDDYSGNPLGCRSLGALVTSTTGGDSSNATCGPYADGFNYITEQDDLAESFACAAQVGTSGDAYELTMNAVETAISDEFNAPGACNEGFIRDNALLVVVVISDEADGPGDPDGAPPLYSSTGTPQSWYESVLAAKDGIPENAAALVLTNYQGGSCVPSGGYDDGANMVEFAGLFGENGFVAGICEPDYGPSFANATAVIQQACENFIPPG